jgi:predicted ester cyclase
MRITIDCTPEEVREFPQLLSVETNIAEQVQQASTVEKNKEILRRFQQEVFNSHDWSIETLTKFLTPDMIDHAARPGDEPGLEGLRNRFLWWQAAFGAAAETNVQMIGERNILAVLYDLKAQHIGEFMGIQPTNRPVTIPGIEFVRFENGKIAEHWGIYDFMSTASEIGAELTLTPRTPGIEISRGDKAGDLVAS